LRPSARTADLNATLDGPNYKSLGKMLMFVVYHRGYHVGKMTALLKKTEAVRLG